MSKAWADARGWFLQRSLIATNDSDSALDTTLLMIVALLCALGLVMVASSSVMVAEDTLGNSKYYLNKQLLAIAMGLCAGLIIYQINTVWWHRMAGPMLIVAIVLLLLLFVPGVGKEVNYSTRWLPLGVLNLQVSEVAKLTAFIYMASYLTRHGDSARQTLSGFIKPLLLFGLLGILILMQPDLGTTIVLFATGMAMLFIGGVRIWQFSMIAVILAAGAAALSLSSDYRLKRVTSFMDPWADPLGDGFQLIQSLIAVGSGNWFGLGLGNSVQKLLFLPEPHTDFIFSVLAEEFGFIGVTVVVLLFVAFIWRTFSIAATAEKLGNIFGAHLAGGIGFWLGIQAFVHMGVDMGVFPTKGLTLPFVSYGGSSMLVTCIAAALLLRIARENRMASPQTRRRRAQK